MDIDDKRLIIKFFELVCTDRPDTITRSESPLKGGTKVVYTGNDVSFEVRDRSPSSKGIEFFAKGEVLNDMGLLYYQSGGRAGKVRNVSQSLEILRLLAGEAS